MNAGGGGLPRIYETVWHGIDLVALAQDQSLLTGGFPNERFYAEMYQRLKEGGYHFPGSWLESRQRLTFKLRSWIEALAREQSQDPKSLKVLSVGAGLGVVELPLIDAGFDITLHDVVPELFDYARARLKVGAGPLKTLVGGLEKVLSASFDVVYVGTCEYCYFDPGGYATFLTHLHRLLRRGGRVIAWDWVPNWKVYVQDALSCFGRRPKGVLWGRLRSPRRRVEAFHKVGLAVRAVEVYDSRWDEGAWCLRNPSAVRLLWAKGACAVIHAWKDDGVD